MGKYSNYKGVTKTRSYWQAQISENGKSIYIGCYPTELAAAKAFNKAAMSIYHDKSYTNPLPGDKDYGIRPALESTTGAKRGCFMDTSNNIHKTSRFKGVYWDRYFQCWKIDIQRYGFRYQELFLNEIEAAIRYDFIMINKYGDKVKYLNFMYTINDTDGNIHRRQASGRPQKEYTMKRIISSS